MLVSRMVFTSVDVSTNQHSVSNSKNEKKKKKKCEYHIEVIK